VTASERIVLVGGGGHASDVLSALEAIGATGAEPRREVVGIVADTEPDEQRFAGRGAPWLGPVEVLAGLDARFVLAVGWPGTKVALLARLAPDARPATVVHPSSEVGWGAELGEGAVVLGGAHVSARTHLGAHVLVSYLASVGHDSRAGARSSVMPGAHVAGEVVLGADVTIGAGAVVLQGLSIGDGAIVGAGAVVLTDVPAGQTVVGSPARSVDHPD
jgi:sugar O-acyltransferase (sialic acid O-acetyltransferase NeuD family)